MNKAAKLIAKSFLESEKLITLAQDPDAILFADDMGMDDFLNVMDLLHDHTPDVVSSQMEVLRGLYRDTMAVKVDGYVGELVSSLPDAQSNFVSKTRSSVRLSIEGIQEAMDNMENYIASDDKPNYLNALGSFTKQTQGLQDLAKVVNGISPKSPELDNSMEP